MPTIVGVLAATMALNEAIGICALFSYALVLVAVVAASGDARESAHRSCAGAGGRILVMATSQ